MVTVQLRWCREWESVFCSMVEYDTQASRRRAGFGTSSSQASASLGRTTNQMQSGDVRNRSSC